MMSWHLVAYGSLHVIVKLSLVRFVFTSSTLMVFLWHSKMLHLPWCLRHIQDSRLAWLLWVCLGIGSWVCIQFDIHWNFIRNLCKALLLWYTLFAGKKSLKIQLKLSPYKMVLGLCPRQARWTCIQQQTPAYKTRKQVAGQVNTHTATNTCLQDRKAGCWSGEHAYSNKHRPTRPKSSRQSGKHTCKWILKVQGTAPQRHWH